MSEQTGSLRPEFEAVEVAPGLYRVYPRVEAFLAAEARAEKAEALNVKLLRMLEWWVNDEQETAIGPASRVEWLVAWLDKTDRKLREYGHKISGDGVQREMGAWANRARAAIAEAEAMGAK